MRNHILAFCCSFFDYCGGPERIGIGSLGGWSRVLWRFEYHLVTQSRVWLVDFQPDTISTIGWVCFVLLNFGKIAGDDALSENNFEKEQKSEFSFQCFDLTSGIEFNFMDYEHGSSDRWFTPFILVDFPYLPSIQRHSSMATGMHWDLWVQKGRILDLNMVESVVGLP